MEYHFNITEEERLQDHKDRLNSAVDYFYSLTDDGDEDHSAIRAASKRYKVSTEEIFNELYLG